ncbi:hypothetical protein [Neotabrizicola shimadae]|uniref:Uncharacterized protein n=1 Tax=Neotabrizicola shimadae TaxID=2807096 RepID=A0A8G0ZYP7_9RHOB|nr:hypothetical protein [Neotabrizicola shimadae]QYZ71451.1 hypothetical protein JO391_08125 [Neotabrizicola shimadae]
MSPDFLLSLDSLARLIGFGLPPGLRALFGAVEPPPPSDRAREARA